MTEAALDLKESDDDIKWPCQALLGGAGTAIYMNVDGMCVHPECHPKNEIGESLPQQEGVTR